MLDEFIVSVSVWVCLVRNMTLCEQCKSRSLDVRK